MGANAEILEASFSMRVRIFGHHCGHAQTADQGFKVLSPSTTNFASRLHEVIS
jgi:hypothetical protein